MRTKYVFSKAKPAKDVPALAKIRTETAGKERITIWLDAQVLTWFRAQVKGGGNYQTRLNEVLRDHIAKREETLECTLRCVLRDKLGTKAV